MASSSSLAEDNYHKYEILEKVWMGYLWHNLRRKHATGKGYFGNFVGNHPGFQFTITRIYDGTRHPMVTMEQYKMMKRELERKTGATLPEINRPINLKDPSNTLAERRIYASQGQFESHIQEFKREREETHNKALRDASEHKNMLCQTLSAKKDTIFLSFDVEVYDRDWSTMLEIGYVKFTLKEGDIPEYFHAIVNEDIHNREGFDNKEKFRFGRTVRMSLKNAAEQLQKGIAGSDALVTHSGHNDEEYLAKNGITMEEKPMFDTQMLGLDLLKKGTYSWSLKRILEETRISFDETILHNAGNDAHYTMLAFKALVKKAMPHTHF